MFDLIAGEARHLPRHPALPMVISTAAQAVLITTAVGVPLLIMTEQLPDVPAIMAFVAAPPLPPPPPPPPAAPQAAQKPSASPRPVPAIRELAPIDVPTRIEPEATDEEGFDEGAPGGVAGGVPGGVAGGVVSGLPDAPPPPPPPPPPAARAPASAVRLTRPRSFVGSSRSTRTSRCRVTFRDSSFSKRSWAKTGESPTSRWCDRPDASWTLQRSTPSGNGSTRRSC